MTRRTLLRRALLATTATALTTATYAWQIEPFWLEFVRRKLPLRNLPAGLEGKTLMQISDLHVGNRFDYGYLIDALKEAQTLQPDIVVYTGDYVSYEDETQLDQLAEVLEHATTGRLGTFGILGNHDYGRNWAQDGVAERIRERLESAGIRVLRNERVDIGGLHITGLDDYWGTNFAPDRALASYDDTAANLALCHNPDVCDLDVWNGFRGWILAGHTHGGQCKPPFLDPPVLPVKNKRYSAGALELGNERQLYINRALGHLWQLRFNVRPEITVFELTSAGSVSTMS